MNDAWRIFLSGLVTAATSPILALSVAFTIAVACVYHWVIARPRLKKALAERTGAVISSSPPDLLELRNRVAALESAARSALQNVGFVRFNAFPDVGSELSYALAVVDGSGDGFIVSSIYSREEVRTYAKSVREFSTDKEVSNEERQALQMARDRAERAGR